MSKDNFIIGDPAEITECVLLPEADPFSENLRSKSKEHTERFATNKNFQKTEKNEEISS